MDKKSFKKSRSIRELKNNAAKGNLLSMLQLYENFSTGQFVGDPDLSEAKKHLNKLSDSLIKTELKISNIKIKNFKRFRELDIKFDKKMTVIVGDNGAGKTSIVDAVTACLSQINNNLLKTNVSGKKIKDSEVNVNASDYSELSCQFTLNPLNHLEVVLFTPAAGYSGKSTTYIENAKALGEMYKLVNQTENATFPLLASYPVERSSARLPTISLEKGFYRNNTSRFNVIKDSLSLGVIAEGFVNAYIELTNLAEGEETQEIRETKNSINALSELIEQKSREGKQTIVDELIMDRDSETNRLQSLLSLKSTKFQESLERVEQVVTRIIPEISSIYVNRGQGRDRLVIRFNESEVDFNQLSQGQKALMALVGDLALRLSALNPHLPNPLEAHGIVVIDEIDLHLHPKWQQSVPEALMNVFPSIQFILTTHSPQALTTVDNECIRKLSFNVDGEADIDIPMLQTRGVRSSDVLERIMGTFSIPQVKEAAWLSDYSALISENQWQTNDGMVLRQKIVSHFGENHPEVMKLDSEIRVQSLRNRAL